MSIDTKASIYVYSKGGCPFCSLLKLEFQKRGIEFTEFDLSDDSTRNRFYKNSGTSTVPQVYVSEQFLDSEHPTGKSFGGWSDMKNQWDAEPFNGGNPPVS